MKDLTSWLDDWKHLAVVFGFLAMAFLFAVFVPDQRWEHLGSALTHLAANPAGALSIASFLGTVAATFYAAWKRVPPSSTSSSTATSAAAIGETATATASVARSSDDDTKNEKRAGFARPELMVAIAASAFIVDVVLDVIRWAHAHVHTLVVIGAIAACTSACGASALQVQAGGTLAAMRGMRAARAAGLADLAADEAACTDDACVAQAHTNHRPLELAIDALRTGIKAWIDVVQLAIAAGGDADALSVVLETAGDVVTLAQDVVREMIDAGAVIPSELAAIIPGAS